ncbi:MAG TPA: 50S ribosomal protein L24 [Thermotogota bacterium]|nr:50S ribosomal protein L24 [Thermotogota bacterium]HRW91365.1 50S ribosomal protein L24 [Thermotogota bacterium]
MKRFRFHIRKEDLVEVISGRDKGKRGRVLKVLPKESKIIVDKVNVVKRHQRPTQQERNGGIIDKDIPLDVSKTMLVCPSCDRPTRVGWKVLENGEKSRFCKKCGEMIDK